MVKQYPDILNVTTVAVSAQDSEGNWGSGSPTTYQVICRGEPGGGEGSVKAADGSRIDYDWTIYFPLGISLQAGTKVELVQNGEVVVTDTVKRFSIGQMNARAWL